MTEVKTVAPRAYLMDCLRDDPNFHHRARQEPLAPNERRSGHVDRPATRRALTLLDGAQVCLQSEELSRVGFVRDDGCEPAIRFRGLRRDERPAPDVA